MEEKKPASFIQELAREELEKDGVEGSDIWKELGMSRSGFHNAVYEDGREIQPKHWANWRRALGIHRKKFWELAMKRYDP